MHYIMKYPVLILWTFVNIWQSGAQLLKDLCLWLRTFFESKSLSLQGGRELIFPHCRTAYSRHGYKLLHLRSENSILFSGISGFNPRWDTAEMHVPIVFKEARHFQIPEILSIKPYHKDDLWTGQATCFGHLFHCYYFCKTHQGKPVWNEGKIKAVLEH